MPAAKKDPKHTHIYETVGKRIPSLTGALFRNAYYAGYEKAERFCGFVVIFSAALSLAIVFALYQFGFGYLSALGLLVGIFFYGITYIIFSLIADSRARFIEQMLPDNLQLISGNVRAGMTVDKAIWLSARPEFGILEEEIRKAGGQTMGGAPLKKSMLEMAGRFKSDIFQRAMRLLTEGMESGGEMAKLLDETSTYIRTAQTMRKEINASVAMYVMFIVFAAALGAPLLFAISLHFVDSLGKISLPSAPEAEGVIKLSTPAESVTTAELFYFALAYIFITSFFSSLIIGLIQTGREKQGLKFFPALFGVAVAVFILARVTVQSLFGVGI